MIKRRKSWARTATQIVFFSLVALISINHTLAEKGQEIAFLSSASTHAICPFGGVVSIYKFVTTGTFVQKIHESSFVLMALAFLAAILFGPVFCGWLCPLGSIQEWFGKLGKRLFGRKYNTLVPQRLDRVLRYMRYVVLIMVIYMTAATGKLTFSDVDPYNALFNFWSSEVALASLVILGLTLAASLVVERPWCKYACPYGAILGLSNLVRIFKIRRNIPSCISCKACDRSCPMNIHPSGQTVVRDHQCISCLVCTSEASCPVQNTMAMGLKATATTQVDIDGEQKSSIIGMRIRPQALTAALVVIFIGGIGVSSALNLWHTESTKIPAKYTIGAYAGQNNPADIRGSYTLGDIVKNFPVTLDDLVKAFALQDVQNPSTFAVKELETRYADLVKQGYEVGTSSVRLFVALQAGLPFEMSEETYLINDAVELLKARGGLSPDQLNYLERHSVAAPLIKPGTEAAKVTEDEKTIKGKTTFQELLDWGLSREVIEQVLGRKLPTLQTGLADFCTQNNLNFTTIKTALQTKLKP